MTKARGQKDTLFEQSAAGKSISRQEPLAERMRPRALDDIIGQEEAIGPDSALGKILRRKNVALPSMILWGPPGTGKTTIARVISEESGLHFVQLSGVLDGVKELRDVVEQAKENRDREGRGTLTLVDEIHRFNKAQQDAFLPHVESGLLTVIGQTTDNVSFRIRNALLSRLRVVVLKPLDQPAIERILARALNDVERGLGALNIELTDDAKARIFQLSGGDARRALTALEWAVAVVSADGPRTVNAEIVEKSFGTQPRNFDQDGDYHYDCISAFIKSLRGSDPDAALYYMLLALDGGEDPLFLTRRMIIFASEDASCDPRALEVAVNVDRALERVGLPEGRIPLAQAAVYLACCAKSNASYKALRAMEKVVEGNRQLEIPRRLRNAPTEVMRGLGNALGYKYPHDYPFGFVPERYLPPELGDLVVYEPSDRGLDAQIRERLEHYRALIKQEKSRK